jgi:hypothetical protein
MEKILYSFNVGFNIKKLDEKHRDSPCSGYKRIPACQCRLLLTKSAPWVDMALRELRGAGVGAKGACG